MRGVSIGTSRVLTLSFDFSLLSLFFCLGLALLGLLTAVGPFLTDLGDAFSFAATVLASSLIFQHL